MRDRKRHKLSTGTTTAIAAAGLVGAYLGWQAVRRLQLQRRNRYLPVGRRIVILGAGFAGVSAALELARQLPHPRDGEIILIDRNDFTLFSPMLTEVLGGQIEPRHIVASARTLPARIRFQKGRIKSIDLHSKQVTVTIGAGEPDILPETRVFQADHLVIALGSEPDYHHTPTIAERSMTVHRLGDGIEIRNRAIALLDRADAEPDPEKRKELTTFVVGGGGYTGVETMAALNDLVRDSLPNYPNLTPGDVRMLIIVPEGRLMTEVTPPLAAYAQKKLEQRGVEVLLGTKISGAGEDYVEIEGGRRVPTRMLIWAAGVRPASILSTLDCARGKTGGVLVDACCEVPGHSGVWAVGDCAQIPQPNAHPYPPTAQNASREGLHAARNIVTSLLGDYTEPFVYTPIGEMALVGKRSGVALIYGVPFSGWPAWALWRAVYLTKMPGLGQRARILADWLLDAAFGRTVTDVPVASKEISGHD